MVHFAAAILVNACYHKAKHIAGIICYKGKIEEQDIPGKRLQVHAVSAPLWGKIHYFPDSLSQSKIALFFLNK